MVVPTTSWRDDWPRSRLTGCYTSTLLDIYRKKSLTSTARLAQSVERETLNLKVAGSTPASGSIPDASQSTGISNLQIFFLPSFLCLDSSVQIQINYMRCRNYSRNFFCLPSFGGVIILATTHLRGDFFFLCVSYSDLLP
ncbi:hypothetical protein F5Y11DRAFT_326176 [Daldinia sp. FL1419]|nr:hypothetical protein F5Y11DRAFT_326176 [Daldinia sp. FL1419]